MNREDFLGLLVHDNVQAFLRVIREGESSQSDDAYRMLYGGKLFDSFEDHPRVRFYEKDDEFIRNGKKDYTTAAGAYQIVESTWNPIAARYGLNDFGSTNQDIAAVALIHERGALDFVLQGRIHEAINRLSPTWASLPGSTYGQPTQRLDRALKVYTDHGGRIAGATAPTPRTPETVPEVKPMAAPLIPIFTALLPIIRDIIPALGSLFGSGSESQQRNVAAATLVTDALTKATNSPNLQAAVEAMQASPEVAAAARAAVTEILPSLGEAGGGGIDGARRAAMAPEGDWRRLVFSLPFIGILIFSPLVWAVVASAVFKAPWLVEMEEQLRGTVIGFVLGTIAGAIVAFIYGSSASSQRKDQMLGGRP